MATARAIHQEKVLFRIVLDLPDSVYGPAIRLVQRHRPSSGAADLFAAIARLETQKSRSRRVIARRLRENAVEYGEIPFFTRKINFPREKSIETKKKPSSTGKSRILREKAVFYEKTCSPAQMNACRRGKQLVADRCSFPPQYSRFAPKSGILPAWIS
jgi:hypothetical protein